ncbi:MAG: (2Fe-2S)-binding protein [Actinomycetota bacterium]
MRDRAEFDAAIAAAGLTISAVAPDDRDGWTPADRFVALDDNTLSTWIDHVCTKRSIDDRTVATMLGWKAFSYLVSVLPLASWARLDVVPDVAVDNLLMDVPGDPSVAFGMREFRLLDTGDSAVDVVDVWWNGLMTPLIERWRMEARLGTRALEAFVVAHAVTIIGGVVPDLAESHARIGTFVAALPERLRPMAKVMEYRTEDGPWKAIGERTSCCLAYKLPAGGYCVSCNLLDDDERTVLIESHGAAWRRPDRTPVEA